MQIDFMHDYEVIMQDWLLSWGYEVPPNLSFDEIGRRFFSARRRVVVARPRRVYKVENIEIPSENAASFEQFCAKVEIGEDLHKYMSKTIVDASYEDGLFNDWQIHHFHFNERPLRSGNLIYAIVEPDDLYVLGIYSHGHFCDRELLESVNKHWPEIFSRHRLKDVVGVQGGPKSSEDIYQLRKAGINALYELSDGSVYFSPGGGVTSAATSSKSEIYLMRLKRSLRSYEEWTKVNAEYLLDQIRSSNNGRTPAASADAAQFQLLLMDEGAFALELASQTAYKIGPAI